MFIAGGSIRLFLRATSRCIKLVKRAMGSFACDLHMVSEYLDKQCLPGMFQAISNLNCVATSSVFPFSSFSSVSYLFVVQSQSCVRLWPHGLQHTRLLSRPLSPGVCSNSCPLSLWCYLAISSSAALFSFCPQGLFQWVISLYQVSKVSAFVLLISIQGWSPLGLTDLISLQSRDYQESSPKPVQ